MTQHFNWGYDRRESRQEYLEDRITQMGHEPDQYEQWYAELEALKAQKKKEAWPGAWGEKTTKQQWSTIERAIGRKLSNATDGELAHAVKAINSEIKRRKKARNRIRKQRLEAKIVKLEADGYKSLPSAGKEVREAIAKHKIFPDLESGRPYENEVRQMVQGKGNPWHDLGPMKSGVLVPDRTCEEIYVKPKALLCFVINRLQHKIDAEKKRQEAYERRQEELRKWEELQKARSAQVAKDWYQQMVEANGRWQKALADHELKKAAATRREVARETQRTLAKHGMNTIPVPTDEPTQSLPNTDQEQQNG